MMRRSRYPWGGPFAVLARTSARVLLGDLQLARDGLQELVQPGGVFDEPGPSAHLLVAVAELWIDAISGLPLDQERLTNLVALVAAAGNDAVLLGPACALVEVAERNLRVDLVRPLEPLLRLAYDRSVRYSTGWIFSIDRMLATIAFEKGDAEQAVALLKSSIAITTETGALPELAHAQMKFSLLPDSTSSVSSDLKREYRRNALSTVTKLGSLRLIEPFREPAESKTENLNGSFTWNTSPKERGD